MKKEIIRKMLEEVKVTIDESLLQYNTFITPEEAEKMRDSSVDRIFNDNDKEPVKILTLTYPESDKRKRA